MDQSQDAGSTTLLSAWLDADMGRIAALSELRFAEMRLFKEKVETRLVTTDWGTSAEISEFLRASRKELRALGAANRAQHEADLVQHRAEAKKRIAEYYGVAVSTR